MKFGAAAIAIASVAGCGSGSAKPFTSNSPASSFGNSTNSGSSSSSNAGTSSATQTSTGATSSGSSTPAGTPSGGTTTTTATSTPASSTPAPSPTPAPAPQPRGPAPSVVLTNIQRQSGWQMCGGCGNEGGTGQGPDYNFTQGVSNPSLSGSATDFYVNGGPAYTGGYYFIEQPTIASPVSYLRYDFDLYIPAQYVDAPQGIEFECQQTVNGDTYNFAWQADYATNNWRVFNYTTKTWEPTAIQLQRFTPNTWHHITAIFHAAGTQAVHDALVVDGQSYNANIGHEATHTGTALEFSNGFQVDLNASSTPYHVYVDNMQVSAAN